MEQYISKSALVAEIEKRQKEEVFYDEDGSFASWADQNHYSILESIKNVINNLEVKEVDLEQEIDKELDRNWYGEYINLDKFRESARHFFELGLKAQKGK